MAGLLQIPETPNLLFSGDGTTLDYAQYRPTYRALNAEGVPIDVAAIRIDERVFILNLVGMTPDDVHVGYMRSNRPLGNGLPQFDDIMGIGHCTATTEMEVVRVFYVVQDGAEVPLWSNHIRVRWQPGWTNYETNEYARFHNLPIPESLDPPTPTCASTLTPARESDIADAVDYVFIVALMAHEADPDIEDRAIAAEQQCDCYVADSILSWADSEPGIDVTQCSAWPSSCD